MFCNFDTSFPYHSTPRAGECVLCGFRAKGLGLLFLKPEPDIVEASSGASLALRGNLFFSELRDPRHEVLLT